MDMMLWNIVLTAAFAAMSWFAKTMWAEQQRLSILLSDSVLDYRAAVRTASGTIETAITDAADLDAFMALYDTPVDENDIPTGNAPINDWPEAV